MQRFGDDTAGLHMQIGKGGGFHLAAYEERNQPMPVAVHIRDDRVGHRVRLTRGFQISAVKGLIGDGSIRARGEAAHHRGRDVAWPRPHGDVDGRANCHGRGFA